MEKIFKHEFGVDFQRFCDDILFEIYEFCKINPNNLCLMEEFNYKRNKGLITDLNIDKKWKDYILALNPTINDLIDSIKNRHFDNEKKLYMLMVPVGPRIKIRKKMGKLGLLGV